MTEETKIIEETAAPVASEATGPETAPAPKTDTAAEQAAKNQEAAARLLAAIEAQDLAKRQSHPGYCSKCGTVNVPNATGNCNC
ncbi:MAG: hypothetical protein WCS42_08425 [Verrucomicrobiota bacterium]